MTVDQIFQEALAVFEYKTDIVQFRKVEYWQTYEEVAKQLKETGKFEGDCEDFAAYVLNKLRQQGYQARYIFCITKLGYHLVVETDGLILDNLQKEVLPYYRLPYKWVSISGYQPNETWHSIKLF